MNLGTFLNNLSDKDGVPYYKIRFIKTLTDALNITQNDDDITLFIEELLKTPEDSLFYKPSTYPATWKSTSSHISAFSALTAKSYVPG